MKIINDYDGASIDIISVNDGENTAILSLKKEGKAYSNYYNFKVINSESKDGIICIRNYDHRLYFGEECVPFYRSNDSDFIRMDQERINKRTDELIIKIKPYETIEISLYPRYIEEDLEKFLNNIRHNDNVELESEPIKQIVIGDPELEAIVIISRLHPGETLSSYFLEGIINKVLENKQMFSDYCYVIYPMVNVMGIKNGNHRYNNNIDYNRVWNNDSCVSEIEFIKSQLDKYNICAFIDVHGDEITKMDYIRTNAEFLEDKIICLKTLGDSSKLRRFVRALLKQGRIINVFDQTAREYVSKKYGCIGMLVELSLVENDINSSREKGMKFISELVEGLKNEEKCNDTYKKQRKLR